jgi:phosphate transport system substrate-binding protein
VKPATETAAESSLPDASLRPVLGSTRYGARLTTEAPKRPRHEKDPELAALNPGVALPADPIRPVHRAEKSGASFVFSNYLARASEEWRKRVGVGLEVQWPTGEACEGSDGVVACVLKTPGAIGYVDTGRANQPGLASVRIKNRDGGFAAPTKRAFQAAAAAFPWSQAPAFSVVLVDQPGAESWPLAASVFVIMPLVVEEPQSAEAALRFFDWALREGGAAAERHGFVALPADLVDTVRGAWRRQIKTTTGEPVWRVR